MRKQDDTAKEQKQNPKHYYTFNRLKKPHHVFFLKKTKLVGTQEGVFCYLALCYICPFIF